MSPGAISKAKLATIESLLAPYTAGKTPGAAFFVAHGGKVLFETCLGFANLESEEKVLPETNFRLASLSKQFTAIALLLLVDQEKLQLSTPVHKVLPRFPNCGKDVEVAHLLYHISGLPDYEKLLPSHLTQQLTDRDVYSLLQQCPTLDFAPGSQFKYSNSGYVILGLIVEEIAGCSLASFFKTHIFLPLEMHGTVAHRAGETEVPHRAYGYSSHGSGCVRNDQNSTSAVLGDGGIYSSLRDLQKWQRAISEKVPLLSPPLWELVFTKGRLISGEQVPYGCGWQINLYSGWPIFSHSGSTIGFRHFVVKIPDLYLDFCLLSNRNEPPPAELLDTTLEEIGNASLQRDESLAALITGVTPLDPYS